MTMQALLEEQRQALQRALDLHATMVSKLDDMDSDAELEICAAATLPAKTPRARRFMPAPLSRLHEFMPAPLSKMKSKMRKQQTLDFDLTADDSDGDEKRLGQPLLAEKGTPKSWAISPKKSILDVVGAVRGHFQSHRRIAEATEEEERQNVVNVDELYHQAGPAASLMRNSAWQNFTFFVIVLNTIYIALDTDDNKAEVLCEATPFFQIMSNAFCTFFVVELGTRFCAIKSCRYLVYDKWFLFDMILVLLLVWETWIEVLMYYLSSGNSSGSSSLAIFSIFRVFRVCRLFRALRAVPEIMILIYGMFSALRSVLATVCLLGFTIYLFGIFFTQLLMDQELGEGVFENVPQAMQFLLIQILCGADPDFIAKMYDGGAAYCTMWLLFIFLSQLTIMNMLIGVVCNAVDETTEDIRNNDFMEEVKKELVAVIDGADQNSDGHVSKEEFHMLVDDENAMRKVTELGVDICGMREYLERVYEGVEEITQEEFLHNVVQFRISKAATVQDLLVLGRMTHMELAQLEDRLKETVAELVEFVKAA